MGDGGWQPESAAARNTTLPDVEAIRDACVSTQTRGKYRSSLKGIKKWIQTELVKDDNECDITRIFGDGGDINLAEFTPKYFERFLVYKSDFVKTATLSGYRSAIKDLYRVNRIALPPEYGDDMKQLFSGMKRIEAQHDQISTPKTSGKQPLTYSPYKTLCKSTLDTLQTDHLLEKDDSVGVVFIKTKTNQEGTGPRDPRHIYANPFSPSTCWVTALAIYLACHPRLQPGALFPGSNQKLRFGKALSTLLKNNGFSKSYGTHSVRKGVATFACGGSTGGPSIVSVCLRCGWSLGGVQDRYFRYEAAGDQFLGRVVAGLPLNDAKFATLPPHFRISSEKDVMSCLQTMFPGLVGESSLVGILRLCLASLVHHAQYLEEHLPKDHPLLSTHLFAQPAVLQKLQGQLELEESRWMHPTGIPPYTELYKKLDRQQQSIDELPNRLEQRMEHVLEKKGVAAGNITRDLLREEIRSLLNEVGLGNEASREATSAPSPSLPRHYHTWGGKFHVLPKYFNFPSIDPLGAWMLWWFGNPKLGYPPYKGIPSDDLDTQQKKATLSEWSIMMRHIINGIEKELDSPMPAILDEQQAIDLFKNGYSKLRLKPSKRKRRADQFKLTTVLRLVGQADQDAGASAGVLPFKRRKRQKRSTGTASSCAEASSAMTSSTATTTCRDDGDKYVSSPSRSIAIAHVYLSMSPRQKLEQCQKPPKIKFSANDSSSRSRRRLSLRFLKSIDFNASTHSVNIDLQSG